MPGGTPKRYSSCSHSDADDVIVDQHDEADVERTSPPHDHLSVDESVVDAKQLNRHRRHSPRR